MAGREAGRPDSGEPERDLPLTQADIDQLLFEISQIFSTEERATAFLRTVRFPTRLIPAWRGDAFDFWATIFEDLNSGAMQMPYRRLITMARRVYSGNQVLASLQDRYQSPEAAAPREREAGDDSRQETSAGEPVPPPQPTCHLVLRVTSDQERDDIHAWLADQELDPQQEWVTATAVSFRLNQADPSVVTQRMRTRPDLGWTVVPPGHPDYLLRQLFIEGPDGRSFRFSDVPASSPVGSVGEELIDQYPEGLPGSDQPLVIDQVAADGSGRRTNPDSTLHEEGIREGSRLRVGFQRRAAAVNPLDRRDALFRVLNQMQLYVDTRPGFTVWPNSATLPAEYDIEFAQASFGPPATPVEQPRDISLHQLSIVLGPDFPITAPRVRWLTEIFHPNVFPTYDCEALRQRDYMRGLVCLGTLSESYQPSLDFTELCATLQDIAGYRNYSVFIPADGTVDPGTGQPLLRGDYYDENAARWAITSQGQERISKIGGLPVLRQVPATRARYGYEIEPDE
jgi:ubiquitin-protein ligase